MKLKWNGERWQIGGVDVHCGNQVRIVVLLTTGARAAVWGRFELAPGNNPVFYTVFGRIIPDLQVTEFFGGEVRMKKFLVQFQDGPGTRYYQTDEALRISLERRAQALADLATHGTIPLVTVVREEAGAPAAGETPARQAEGAK